MLGVAKIVEKEPRRFFGEGNLELVITHEEAVADGFVGVWAMELWMLKVHGSRVRTEPVNKLTVEWLYKGPILD